jgi:GNAT superfamily N-acetyltransferase
MSLELFNVTSRKELKTFQQLPRRIYAGNPNWVPPLLSQERALLWPGRHPFHDHALISLFVAQRDGETVGRIGACLNEQHNVFHGERAGFFGFFESVNDSDVAAGLFSAAKQWLRGQGVEIVRGPCNWSTNESCGLLIHGFETPPVIMMPYNPPYYADLLEHCGFDKAKDLLAYYLSTSISVPPRIARIAARAKERGGITIRSLDATQMPRELETMQRIYNAAWRDNWGFVPMTTREFRHLEKEVRSIMDPNLFLIAEKGGTAVGFSITLPNANEVLIHLNGRLFPFGFLKALWYGRKIRQARLLVLGVDPEFRRKGIEALLIFESLIRGKAAKFTGGELSWILEDNRLIIRDIEAMGAEHHKTYRIYESSVF